MCLKPLNTRSIMFIYVHIKDFVCNICKKKKKSAGAYTLYKTKFTFMPK